MAWAALRGEGLDVGDGVPGLSRGAAGPLQLASADELAYGVQADAEELCGLVGGEVTGPQVLGLHGPMVPEAGQSSMTYLISGWMIVIPPGPSTTLAALPVSTARTSP